MSDVPSPQDEPEGTLPHGLAVRTHGINAPDIEKPLIEAVYYLVKHVSRMLDLSTLDGVTIAADHAQAITELDRGHPDLRPVPVSDGNAVGVAMTVMVVRDGRVKSHVFFDLQTVAPLIMNSLPPEYAVHVIGHECAHVEVTANFDHCFPGHLLNRDLSVLQEIRWDMALGCVDEYLVTRICATSGADVTEPYEDLFLEFLAACTAEADMVVLSFAQHGDRLQVLIGVHRVFGSLIKRAAYHLGNLDGHRRASHSLPRTKTALDRHWLGPFIPRFHEAFRKVAEDYGEWTDAEPFMAVALLYEELLATYGIRFHEEGHRRLMIDISAALNRV